MRTAVFFLDEDTETEVWIVATNVDNVDNVSNKGAKK